MTFSVATRKLLSFLVSDRGIEVDSSKIKAILEMPPPKSEKEIRGFLGRLQYISQSITKITSICEPIFKLLRKNEPHKWKNKCQKVFELIKEYLLHPPILVPPQHGRPLHYLSKRFQDKSLRKVMLRTCLGYTKIEIYHLTFPNMGGSKNGPVEVSL